ncbi:kinase-like protein [Lentithecium fluviatile CBS 122367]|uniref:Autophagy-related protein 1 n=1 Tax=Lentithecium fluviatile CBS 122367 TaxID=1168545 RepID=A0A6G1IQX3_9PLEO|nr:kinase-like protein [Lentithecium fluviatile CBS 122367]
MPADTDADATAPRPDRVAGSALEHAFDRLPRPQKVLGAERPVIPTKASLLQVHKAASSSLRAMRPPPPPPPPPAALQGGRATTLRSPPPRLDAQDHEMEASRQMGPMVTLGQFTQDGVEWAVRAQRGRLGLIMVKKTNKTAGLKEKNLLDGVRHKNITRVIHTFWEEDGLCLALEYCRFTLAEILHVHLRLEEHHIKHIARSVFDALAFLAPRGIAHRAVQTKSIRFTSPDLRIVLSDFQQATFNETYSNSDLVALGFVLLECMEGHLLPDEKRNLQFVRDQRALNKVFGLSKAEQWSGSKNLMDFLDDLFNDNRAVLVKVSKPHRFVSTGRDDWECMRPYIELVTLECFTLWTPAGS